MNVPLTLLIMAICLLVEGFFSGSEIAAVSADRLKLRHKAAKGSRGARMVLKMLESPDWLLSTTLVGTNVAVVTSSTLATALMIHLFGESGAWLAIVLVAPLVWIFGEIVPKSVFQQRANSLAPKVVFPLRAFSLLFSPVLLVFSFLARVIARFLGTDLEPKKAFTLREQIQAMIRLPAATGGDIEPVEQTMITRMFQFGEKTVGEVMVPLFDVVAIEEEATVGEAIKLAAEQNHTRIPVYRDRIDQIVGLLHVLELLDVNRDEPIAEYVKPVDYVPGAKEVEELLLEMRKEGSRVSIIVDEFGGAEGIITTEDIVEEVVEDIEDEYDADEEGTQRIRKLGNRDYIVSARVELETLATELGIILPEGDYTTLAGFLIEHEKDIPEEGSVITYDKYTFIVRRALPQAVVEVRVRW